MPRRLDRHQHRRRDPAGARARAGPHHRHRSSADYGTRYQSKLFNPEFLRSKNLPVPDWMDETPRDRRALREGRLMAFETEALFRDDAYLGGSRGEGRRRQRSRRHHSRPHDLLRDVGRAAGRHRLLSRPTAPDRIAATITGETKDEIIHVPAADAGAADRATA